MFSTLFKLGVIMLKNVLFVVALLCVPYYAHGQEGECADGLCGTPEESGGGGEAGGGSVLIANSDQGETQQYADDFDEDGFEDEYDNCPWTSNPDQIDGDGDGWGDACDTCPIAWNPNQFDHDNDGEGDWCDDDIDGDTIPNGEDNCETIPNPAQVDTDTDLIGDVCDDDDDGDVIPDYLDECPLLHRADYSRDMECVTDQDMDNIYDHLDNCVDVPNLHQEDRDGDGRGDVCDTDADGNGIADHAEHRPENLDAEIVVDNGETIEEGGCNTVKTFSFPLFIRR
tara:strand:+ start:969 stop:1820 length:852 start_codon:yes stop_codon:yes gene_type:complete